MKIKKMNSEEISFICSQFAVILKTGVALHDGVDIIMEDMESEAGRKILKDISDTLNDEKPLYMAMDNAGVFPDYVVHMVEVGEMTGRLDEVLENLSQYYDTETQIKRSVHDAILQPMLILGLMFVVIAALVIKVIPVFGQIFKQFNPVLGESISKSIGISSKVGIVAMIVIGVIFLTVIILYLMSGVVKNNAKFERVLSIIPGVRSVLDKYAVTRFANAMYLMIKSGVDSTVSMEYAIALNTNRKLGEKLEKCYERLQNYDAFADVIAQSDIFIGIYKHMIKLAYKTGAYEQAWKKINDKYSDELSNSLVNIIAFIEPVLVATVTIIIGVVLIAVMLPLISVMGSI